MLRKTLLVCGIAASILYVAIDWLAAFRYPAYQSFTSQAISELMAKGAPTELFLRPFFLAYGLLMVAFGAGVWAASGRTRVRVVGGLLLAYSLIGLPGPFLFQMTVRGATTGTNDVLHIALTAVLVVLMMAAMAVGASLWGRRFRVYSYATIAASLLFGGLTSIAMRPIATGGPTPWVGVLERMCIGAFLQWVVVLAVMLLRERSTAEARQRRPRGVLFARRAAGTS